MEQRERSGSPIQHGRPEQATARVNRDRDAHPARTDVSQDERKSGAEVSSADVYQIVTDRIISALEAGVVPWHKPWSAAGGLPRNLSSGRPYRGMNILLLSLGQPFESPWWVTFKQAQELGGSVRKGEKSSLVTFWKFSDRKTGSKDESDSKRGDTSDTVEDRRAPLLRTYHVFNLEQTEGIEHPPSQEFQPRDHERLALCEAVVDAMPQRPTIQADPRRAFYSPALDIVSIPDLSRFESAESYYVTLFHELAHSTGHPTRLARPALGTPAAFGTPDYGKEELVAEFGAALLAGHVGIFPTVAENQAAYIDGWLSVLSRDKRLLPVAAAQAQRAVDFILGNSPETNSRVNPGTP